MKTEELEKIYQEEYKRPYDKLNKMKKHELILKIMSLENDLKIEKNNSDNYKKLLYGEK